MRRDRRLLSPVHGFRVMTAVDPELWSKAEPGSSQACTLLPRSGIGPVTDVFKDSFSFSPARDFICEEDSPSDGGLLHQS